MRVAAWTLHCPCVGALGSGAMSTLEISFVEREALLALIDHQLSKGMVFLPDAGGVEPLSTCTLVIVFEGRSHTLLAEIVYVREEGPGRGVGLQLPPLDDETLEALRALAHPTPEGIEAVGDRVIEGGSEEEDEEEDDTLTRAPQLHERMRSLSSAEQQRMAATGTLQERTMLERLYGPNVWEALLTGGRLSPPEVARIARKGTVPRPLLEAIGANGSWLASSLVQRALLTNPRCPSSLAQRVLQAMSKRDLALVPQQSAYPAAVRQAAKAMLKR